MSSSAIQTALTVNTKATILGGLIEFQKNKGKIDETIQRVNEMKKDEIKHWSSYVSANLPTVDEQSGIVNHCVGKLKEFIQIRNETFQLGLKLYNAYETCRLQKDCLSVGSNREAAQNLQIIASHIHYLAMWTLKQYTDLQDRIPRLGRDMELRLGFQPISFLYKSGAKQVDDYRQKTPILDLHMNGSNWKHPLQSDALSLDKLIVPSPVADDKVQQALNLLGIQREPLEPSETKESLSQSPPLVRSSPTPATQEVTLVANQKGAPLLALTGVKEPARSSKPPIQHTKSTEKKSL